MAKKGEKTVTGVVESNSGDKSIKVVVNLMKKHHRYGKYIRRRTRLGVHDEHNEAQVGDVVTICQSRPRSKTKSWRLVDVVERKAAEE